MTGGAAGSAAAPPIWRRRWLVWLLTIAAVAEIGAGATALVHVRAVAGSGMLTTAVPSRPRVDARPTTPALRPADDRTAQVRQLLDGHATALRTHDRAAWLAGIDPRAPAFRTRQAAVFDALAAVPLATWEYELNAGLEQSLGRATLRRYAVPVWTPGVTLRYALRSVDAQPGERPMVFTFVRRGTRWYLASDADITTDGARSWRGLWDFGRVVVRRGQSGLVLAHPAHAADLATFVRAIDDAVPAVTAVWGPGWRRQVAVLLPDTQTEMAALVGERFALARIAAVAIADDVDMRAGKVRGQRVVVNPANLGRLGTLSRQIVFRHEITHIASRAATSQSMPTWLVEGFADYVGYAGVGLPVGVIAPDLRAEVRAGTWSGSLPADTDFTGDAPGLAVAYESGWTACRLIADRVGVAGLVRFYRLAGTAGVSGRAALDTALRKVLHLTYAEFVGQWRAAVRAELG